MPRKLLTPPVLKQKAPPKGVEIRDTLSPLVLRITKHGRRSFIVRVRIKGQKQPIRLTCEHPPHAGNLETARMWAGKVIAQCRGGQDPRLLHKQGGETDRERAAREERDKFSAIITNFLNRHAARNKSFAETKRILELYVLPGWKDRQISSIGRAEIVSLLDKIETGTFKAADGKLYGGPVMADSVLAQVRKLMNWHATRDDRYTSPIVKGMARTRPKERARRRKLSDDEIRALWRALDELDERAAKFGTNDSETEDLDTFGTLVRVLLLTAQRREEVSHMARAEISAEGLWAVPAERCKNGIANEVPLSRLAREIIDSVAVIDECDFVFTTNGKTPFSGFSKSKRRLDRLMLAGLLDDATERNDQTMLLRYSEIVELLEKAEAGDNEAKKALRAKWWILHDLRRTAKSLMARAGVRPDISERVLNHMIAGVEGVYDRHDYIDEKCAALEALAGLVERIAGSSSAAVVPFARVASS